MLKPSCSSPSLTYPTLPMPLSERRDEFSMDRRSLYVFMCFCVLYTGFTEKRLLNKITKRKSILPSAGKAGPTSDVQSLKSSS